MPYGITASIILHGLLMAAFIFGMPKFVKFKEYENTTVVMDIVDISEITNIKIKQAVEKKKVVESKTATPKSQKVEKKIKKEVKEPIKTAEAKSKKIQDAEIIPDKKKKQVKKSKKATSKPPEKAKSKKVKDDSFEKSILKSVEEAKNANEKKKLDKDFADLSDALKGKTDNEYNRNIPMSISEIDAIKSQITRNWNTTAFGGSDSMGMRVKVIIELDMQGNVIRISPKREHNSSPYYVNFVESALRAIKMSSPIQRLNTEKFSQWRKIEFNFDSEGMIY